jgi:hypothetical protein
MSGVYEPLSPRAPVYSAKLIARAVELYQEGVKPGDIRWADLHSTLRAEFASELKDVRYDLPNPETVMAWVKKYPNLSQRLKDLRVQQATPEQGAQRKLLYPPAYLPYLAPSVPNSGTARWDVLLRQMMTVVLMAWLFSFARALSADG